MATDKLLGDKIFDWYYPDDRQDCEYLIQDLEKYIANPRNKHVIPYLEAQKKALQLLLTIPLGR